MRRKRFVLTVDVPEGFAPTLILWLPKLITALSGLNITLGWRGEGTP